MLFRKLSFRWNRQLRIWVKTLIWFPCTIKGIESINEFDDLESLKMDFKNSTKTI